MKLVCVLIVVAIVVSSSSEVSAMPWMALVHLVKGMLFKVGIYTGASLGGNLLLDQIMKPGATPEQIRGYLQEAKPSNSGITNDDVIKLAKTVADNVHEYYRTSTTTTTTTTTTPPTTTTTPAPPPATLIEKEYIMYGLIGLAVLILIYREYRKTRQTPTVPVRYVRQEQEDP